MRSGSTGVGSVNVGLVRGDADGAGHKASDDDRDDDESKPIDSGAGCIRDNGKG